MTSNHQPTPTRRRVFWQRPTLRGDEEEERDRRVTWLELFFDLFIVVVVAEMAHHLAEDISWAGVGTFIFLFLHLWWVWIGITYYTERFETDGFENRLFIFLAMIPVGGMAVFAHHALGETSVGFALSYAASRSLTTYLWWRGGRYDARFRPTARRFVFGFTVSITLFLVSVLVPPPDRFALWALGLVCDVLTPAFTLHQQAQLPRFSSSKLPERFGLFVIIVLGESIVGVTQGVAAQEPVTLTSAITGILGIALAFGVWWIYFDFVNRRPPKPGIGWSFAWGYLHMPLIIAIAATGAAILNVVADDDWLLSRSVSLLLASAVGISLMVMGLLELTVQHSPDEPTHPRLSPSLKFAGGAIALLLGLVGEGYWVIALQLALFGLLAVQMIYGLYVWFTQELPLVTTGSVSLCADYESIPPPAPSAIEDGSVSQMD